MEAMWSWCAWIELLHEWSLCGGASTLERLCAWSSWCGERLHAYGAGVERGCVHGAGGLRVYLHAVQLVLHGAEGLHIHSCSPAGAMRNGSYIK